MPIRKVKGGWQWGTHGKVYKTREGAERQARAAYAHGYQGGEGHQKARPKAKKKSRKRH